MGKFGKFDYYSTLTSNRGYTFVEDGLSIHEHLLKDEIFQIVRIMTEDDPYFKMAKNHESFDKGNFKKYGGVPIDFLSLVPSKRDNARIHTIENGNFELDPIKKLIIPTKSHYGREFGQYAVSSWYYGGTEKDFFDELYELGYKQVIFLS